MDLFWVKIFKLLFELFGVCELFSISVLEGVMFDEIIVELEVVEVEDFWFVLFLFRGKVILLGLFEGVFKFVRIGFDVDCLLVVLLVEDNLVFMVIGLL